MDIRKLQRVIVDGLEDVKAQNIVVFNTEHLSPLFERVIIASGTSNRQTKSLAASVRDAVKTAGAPAPRTEGEGNGEWIIVDCGAAVVHVMQPAIREYYHLEELWGEKPVRMKVADAAPTRLVKAASSALAPAAKRAAPSRQVREATVAGPATKSAAGPAAKKRPAARKAAPAKRVLHTAGVKKPMADAGLRGTAAAKRAPAKKTAAAKTTAKRAPMSKAPPKKVVARR
ncbi:MAG: ribosome silencing factor [Caldimonas sp.]